MRWIIAIFLYNLSTMQTAWAGGIDLSIGTQRIHAAVANNTYDRERGLMKSTQLCSNCGMLFVFPQAGKHSFWMKNTPLPLSIAFIAADGTILNIDEMQANTTHSHRARDDALYALEMNKGWFAENAIKSKDRVYGLQNTPRGQ
jgi:uncharacterized protein